MKYFLIIILSLVGCTDNSCEPPVDYWSKCECNSKLCQPSEYKPKEIVK